MMMAGPYAGTLSDLPTVRDEVTCSINAENPTKLRCVLRAYCGGTYTRYELLFHDAVS